MSDPFADRVDARDRLVMLRVPVVFARAGDFVVAIERVAGLAVARGVFAVFAPLAVLVFRLVPRIVFAPALREPLVLLAPGLRLLVVVRAI
ncbi:MAG: hypothetical protein PHW76_07725 [Alphaproteobacteria bacterium]|nr:hypothetical protein [Alphaproteobacteria bacterium]